MIAQIHCKVTYTVSFSVPQIMEDKVVILCRVLWLNGYITLSLKEGTGSFIICIIVGKDPSKEKYE